MRVPVSAITEREQHAFQIRHVTEEDAGVGAEVLFKVQVARFAAEIAGLQQIERLTLARVVVGVSAEGVVGVAVAVLQDR